MKADRSNPDISLYDPSVHGDRDYHVQVYFIDLSQAYMKYIRWQWHTEFEIIIVNHGEADVLADEKMIHLAPGQGLFINQNVLHAIHPSGESRNCTLYSLVFHPDFLFGYNNTILSTKYLAPIISSPELKMLLLDEANPLQERLLDCVNDVIATNAMKAYGYELLTKTRLFQFWTLILEYIKPTDYEVPASPPVLPLDEMRIKDAIRYVEENYASPITLDILADSIHVSKSECCRCFKRILKLTPIEYVMRFRIFSAAKLLHSNDPATHSISDLAFSVGFNSVSYFNKVFKHYLHQTPTEYKNSIKKDPNQSFESFILMR